MKNKVPPAVVMLVLASLMWVVSRRIPGGHFELPLAMQVWLPALLILAGAAVMIAGGAAFRKAKTTVNPLKPETASNLVVAGVYRKTRNPMYVGMLLMLSALPVYLGNLPSFVLLPCFVFYINRYQIAPEEEALEKLFGDDFREYCREVRRWI